LSLKGSRVLVTGGAGFIGSHLIDQLAKLDCSIVAFDNMSKGRLENIRDPLDRGNVKLIRGDIRRYLAVKSVVKDVDYVFHAAAMIESCNPTMGNSLIHDTNVTGTLNLLTASSRSDVNRLIYFSSAAVYGEPSILPVSEEAQTNPVNFYGVSKLAGEYYCKLFNSAYGLRTISLRLFNVYGPRQGHGPYPGVVTNFVDMLLKGKRPIIYGDGLQTRDFTHVSDAARAVVIAASSKHHLNGGVFNIGSGKAITIRSLARRLADICGKKGFSPIYKSARQGDIRRSCADMRRSINFLGFHCRISLDEGLEDYVASGS
jgi:UDP-glucose 4-epimerase